MAFRGSRPVTVWTIIGINLLVFIATVIDRNLILFLGLQPASLLARPWTIVTNIFVHSGIWHVLANMITLYFFGSFLYHLVGRNRFLVVYFAGGILGNIFYILLTSSLFSIAIGASGAIFAIAGVLAVLMPRLRVLLYFIIPLPLWVVVLVFFFLWSFIPGLNIAWQAHLGGLVLGLIAGYIFRRRARYYYR